MKCRSKPTRPEPPASWRRRPHRRRIAVRWGDHPLGAEPDAHIARRIGCTPQAVGAARRRRGIAPYRPPPRLTVARAVGLAADHVLSAEAVAPAFGGSRRRALTWLNAAARRGLLLAVGATRNRRFVVDPGRGLADLAGAAGRHRLG